MSGPSDWLIGAAEFCDIRVESSKVSGRHAVLREHAGQYWVCDAGSSNGSWLRGTRLTSAPAAVTIDEAVSLGSLPFTVRDLLAMRRDPPGTRHLVVGASSTCDICLDSPKVSSKHAQLSVCGTRTWITDLGSTNGLHVAGIRVHRSDLQPGVTVTLGTLPFDWQAALQPAVHAPPVPTASWVIGSGPDADIRVDAPMVSARHARISKADDGAWWIDDLGSSNGVHRAGQRIKSARLPPDGQIGLGSHQVDVNWLIAQTKPRSPPQPVVETPKPSQLPPTRVAAPAPRPTELSLPRQRFSPSTLAASLVALVAIAGGVAYMLRDPSKLPPPAPPPDPAVVPAPPPPNGWQPAWPLLATSAPAARTPDRGQQVLGAMALDSPATAPAQRFRPPEAVLDFLREHEQTHADFDHTRYGAGARLKADGESKPGTANLPQGGDFMVPNLAKLPVRNQQKRGTCAAFAGIGNIEAAVLKAAPSLAGVDLSEQHYYWLSKPECRSGGCTQAQEGSSIAEGFRLSRGKEGFAIPLERDCAYVPEFRSNDTQSPQPESCGHGVASVRQVAPIHSVQGLVNALRQHQLPIPIGTRLSRSFETGETMVTLAGSGTEGQTRHTGGHAYLVVGYQHQPALPDEGSICFVVRNSWGPGWGRGGYSCVTQAWLQTFWDSAETELVTEVAMGPELGGDPAPPAPQPPVVPPPSPAPAANERRTIHLAGLDGRAHAGSVQVQDNRLQVSLPWRDGGPDGSVALKQRNRQLFQDDVAVGRVDGDLLYLCSGPFATHCKLEATTAVPHQLRIVVAGAHAAPRFGATGKADDWVTVLATPDGGKLEALVGEAGAKLAVRIRLRYVPVGGEPTPEVDLALQDGRLVFDGRTVGSIRPGEVGLCTGPWARACEWFGSEDGLVLLRRPVTMAR